MNALVTAGTLLFNQPVEVQIFSLGFLFLLYWQWPIVTALTLFIEKDLIQIPIEASRKSYMKQVEAVKDRILEMYGPVAVLNGKMAVPREAEEYWAEEGHFLQMMQNASKSGIAKQTWTLLGQDVLSGAWEKAARGLADYLRAHEVCSITDLMTELQWHECTLFTGIAKHYMSMRFLRTLIFVLGKRSQDSLEDWKSLSTMSRTVCAGVQSEKVASYDAACAAEAALANLEGMDEYCLLDLVCYIGLRH